MRLAAQIGCTLDELGERMSAEEFGLWEAFAEEEPPPAIALKVAVAQVRAALANGPLKPPLGRNSFAARDFFEPSWQPEPDPDTPLPPLEPPPEFFASLLG